MRRAPFALLAVGAAAAGGADFDYDVFVIGGGSGGLACAKEAAALGGRVGLCDFVRPSPRGSSWGLGGTCVNVGCIPKKLMHRAGQLRQVLEIDAPAFGYELGGRREAAGGGGGVRHSWRALVQAVQRHIKGLNFGYRSSLQKAGVEFIGAHGSLAGGHGVALRDRKGAERVVSAKHIVLAVGGRPKYPAGFAGAEEVAITSDDLFGLKAPPGRTLVIGGGYVALECAGFLAGLGYKVSVLLRSVPLRGFDAQCAEMVLAGLEAEGVTVLRGATPVEASAAPPGGRASVSWQRRVCDEAAGTCAMEQESGEFDTVLVATGRSADTGSLNLGAVGLSARADGKVETANEATSAAHVFAVGDAASESPSERPELTPVAIRAGKLLARRLLAAGEEALESGGAHARFGAAAVPTAVFTPLEYACVGWSEEEALERLGDDLEVYHSHYTPLEWTLSARPENACYAKVLCDASDGERVVGMHVVGEHAAEIMQGFALALRLGATKADLDATIGIHPCTAEEIVGLHVTKRSGLPAEKDGC